MGFQKRDRAKRAGEDSRIRAFELLASLAGKLLEEGKSSASSNASAGHDHVSIGKDVKLETRYDDKPLKTECVEHVSCDVSVVTSDWTSENSDNSKEHKHSENNAILKPTLKKAPPASSEQINDDLKYTIRKHNVGYGSFPGNLDGCSPNFGELCDGFSENGVKREVEANNCPTMDPLELSMTFPAPINSDRDVKLPSCSDSVPNASFSRHRNDIKLGSRDDDEKFSRFNKLSNRLKVSRPATRFEDRRIRKLLTSKYWKATPKLKDFEDSRAGKCFEWF